MRQHPHLFHEPLLPAADPRARLRVDDRGRGDRVRLPARHDALAPGLWGGRLRAGDPDDPGQRQRALPAGQGAGRRVQPDAGATGRVALFRPRLSLFRGSAADRGVLPLGAVRRQRCRLPLQFLPPHPVGYP